MSPVCQSLEGDSVIDDDKDIRFYLVNGEAKGFLGMSSE